MTYSLLEDVLCILMYIGYITWLVYCFGLYIHTFSLSFWCRWVSGLLWRLWQWSRMGRWRRERDRGKRRRGWRRRGTRTRRDWWWRIHLVDKDHHFHRTSSLLEAHLLSVLIHLNSIFLEESCWKGFNGRFWHIYYGFQFNSSNSHADAFWNLIRYKKQQKKE